MRFGNFNISAINFGFFRLDGGAMFGSIPKNIWSKRVASDNENCIELVTRSLVISDGKRTFITDVGMGTKWTSKQTEIFGIRNLAVNLDKQHVTDIILTHLHFDHAGGISQYKPGTSELELCYPQARVWLQKDNWENAKNPTPKERASYLRENIDILSSADLNLLRGSNEIYPNIWVHQVDGHTLGQQWVEIKSGAQSIRFPTDLIPTALHLPIAFHMGYDTCASTIMREKEAFLSQALSDDILLVFQHDPKIAAAKVKVDDKGQYNIKEVTNFD